MNSSYKLICLLNFIIALTYCAKLDDPKLYPWPNQFFDSHATNKTRLEDMKPLGVTMMTMRWYDWDKFAMKSIDTYPDAVANTTTFIGKVAWIFNDFTKFCVKVELPVTAVKPDWMVGGEYVGRKVVNGIETDVWDKQDHLYYQSIVGIPQPKAVFAPIDQLGNAIRNNYGFFEERTAIPGDTFEIPAYCAKAKTFSHKEVSLSATLTPFGYL